MKVAIVQDELISKAGGERVGLCYHYAFPEAPVFSIAYNPEGTFPEFKNVIIQTNWYSKIAQTQKKYQKYFFPLGILASSMLDLTDFDIVIESGTHCSKYVRVKKNALVISYCYTPFRLAWNPTSYESYLKASGLKKVVFDTIILFLKFYDFRKAQRPNFFVAMTEETKNRIINTYKHKKIVQIIPPPVNCSQYKIAKNAKNDYYLIVSRLEFYKKVDLVVNVFNKLGYKLIVVGKGTQEENLKEIASNNIEFRKGVSGEDLADLYANCKGFLMPQHEDYGITPLEANASGRPVIAYAKGGVLETMIPYQEDQSKCTALFFDEQTEESLANAIEKFETLTFDPQFIRNHAEKFDEPIFVEKIRTFVLDKAKERGYI
jgi:glycosyltransferase involved in cell wall biosynthesis